MSALCLPLTFWVLLGTGRVWSGAERGCLGLTYGGPVRDQLKWDKQDDGHFETCQDSLGQRAFATGEARGDLALGPCVLPASLLSPLKGQGLGRPEQIGAYFGSLILAFILH